MALEKVDKLTRSKRKCCKSKFNRKPVVRIVHTLPTVVTETDVANFSSIVQTLTGMHSTSSCTQRFLEMARKRERGSSKKAKVSSLPNTIITGGSQATTAMFSTERLSDEVVSRPSTVVKEQEDAAQLRVALETQSDISLIDNFADHDLGSWTTDIDYPADAISMLGVDSFDIFTMEELGLPRYNLRTAPSSAMFTVWREILQDEFPDPFCDLDFLELASNER